jgi:predicted house-cleaning noncanonical NTP pyrophosphatase (MazG superfamily)
MPTFMLNKLVRDKIVADQLQSGQNPVYRTLNAEEHAQALAAKIVEEAQEIPVDNREEAVKELADVQQVLDDLQAVLDITPQEIAAAQATRHAKVGGFKDALFVESVSPAEDNKWTAYYRTEPDRFTEIAG